MHEIQEETALLTKRESQIASLEAYLGEIQDSDSEFANSLVSQFRTKGKLSDKQWQWVGKLVKRHCK